MKLKNWIKKIPKSIFLIGLFWICTLKIYSHDSISTADKYFSLGENYGIAGDYNKTAIYWKKSLNIKKTLLGEKDIDTLKIYFYLAKLYETKIYDYSKALIYYKKISYFESDIYKGI